MNKYAHTLQIVRSVRQTTDTAVLFYSAGGKDSIALLDILAREFNKVICCFMYLVKGLQHIEPYIHWAENHYSNVEIQQISHFMKSIILHDGIFCNPNESVKRLSIGDIEETVRKHNNSRYAFSGMKGVDGYMKRMRLKIFAKNNFISPKGMVYPLALWTNGEVLKYIQSNNLIQPFTYGDTRQLSQGLSFNPQSLLYLRAKFPQDYQRIVAEFPYCDLVIYNYEREQSFSAGTKRDPA